jgi:hypothetical protein
VAAAWHLSNAEFHLMPWLVYDFKRDSLLEKIAEIKGTEHIDVSFMPKKPGIYFVHPHPDDKEVVQAQLMKVWEQQNTGVFIDEGYMVSSSPNSKSSLRLLLTQGRSLHIPMIMLSQRPVWLDRFVFSESDFYQVFALNHVGDRNKIMEYIPHDISNHLPAYHSYWHDVSGRETVVLKPVPTDNEIFEVIDRKLETLRAKKRRTFI